MFESNFFAVLTATLLALAIGVVWYSPWVCGRIWMKAVGLSDADLERGVWHRFVAGFIAQFVLLYAVVVLTSMMRSTISVWTALLFLALAFLAMQSGTVIWERKSLAYFLVNSAYTIAVVVGCSAIVLYWPW